jgi:hypothetical protein
MCAGVECQEGGRIVRVYFPHPRAALPVRLKSGAVTWVAWGRREGEEATFPPGGWARLESIQAGKWEKYRPRPVLIAALRFMEKDAQGIAHWFEIPATRMMQGLAAHLGSEMRLYVVTTPAPAGFADWHARWPRLVPVGDRAG